MDGEGGIGKNNRLPWCYPEDLARFKERTLHHPLVMGRKTFQSLPAGPLADRLNLVLSRDLSFEAEGALILNSLESVLDLGERERWPLLFVIGGAEIYEAFLPRADRLELTRIDQNYHCDCFFPDLDWGEWNLIDLEREGELTFEVYERSIRTK